MALRNNRLAEMPACFEKKIFQKVLSKKGIIRYIKQKTQQFCMEESAMLFIEQSDNKEVGRDGSGSEEQYVSEEYAEPTQ